MPSKKQSSRKESSNDFLNQSPPPFSFPGPDKKRHDQDDQKLLLEALQLASDTSDYSNSQKRKEFLDSLQYLQSEQPVVHAKPAVKVSESPLSDDRLLKRKYRSQANAQEATALRSTFMQGQFSKAEKEQVQAAVDGYLQEKDIPLSDLHYLVHRKSKIATQGPLGPMTTNPYSAVRSF